MNATVYPRPDNADKRQSMIQDLVTRIDDIQQVLQQSRDHQYNLLYEVARSIEKS